MKTEHHACKHFQLCVSITFIINGKCAFSDKARFYPRHSKRFDADSSDDAASEATEGRGFSILLKDTWSQGLRIKPATFPRGDNHSTVRAISPNGS